MVTPKEGFGPHIREIVYISQVNGAIGKSSLASIGSYEQVLRPHA